MKVIHSSLRLFVNSSPVLFPEIDRRLGIIARQDERTGAITVETESPSFLSTIEGERIDNDNDIDLLDAADSLVRSRLLSLALRCDKTATELTTHAARLRKTAAQKTLIDNINSEPCHNPAIVAIVRPSTPPSRSNKLDLEDI